MKINIRNSYENLWNRNLLTSDKEIWRFCENFTKVRKQFWKLGSWVIFRGTHASWVKSPSWYIFIIDGVSRSAFKDNRPFAVLSGSEEQNHIENDLRATSVCTVAYVETQSHSQAHRAALISVSLALSQTPVYTARPWIWGPCIVRCACLHPRIHWYSLCSPTEGWPGWVEVGGFPVSQRAVTHPSTNQAQPSID